MTESEYENRSHDAIDNAWGEYEADFREVGAEEYEDTRAVYVDDELVVSVTNAFRREFITCFHEHFDCPHVAKAKMASVGQRRLKYIERIQFDLQGNRIINIKRIRGV